MLTARGVLRTISQWGAAAAAGALADAAEVPLAWVLGPLVITAVFSIAGSTPYAPVQARRLGQIIVGTVIGLNMTTEAAASLLVWLPVMVLTAIVSMLLAAAISGIVARGAGIDGCSAYFALLPGGLTEMANVGSRLGARSEAISLVHALRVALTVMIVPWAVVMMDTQADIGLRGGPRVVLDLPIVVLLAAAAVIGTLVLRKVRFSNPWMLGALAAVGVMAGSGLVEGQLPAPLLWLGQFFIGMAVGARFKRDIMRRLPRLALVSSLAILFMALVMAGYALAIKSLGASDLESLILAVSSGGFAEMTLTAQMLHLDVALVTGFHFVRAFAVNSLAAPLWCWLIKLGWLRGSQH